MFKGNKIFHFSTNKIITELVFVRFALLHKDPDSSNRLFFDRMLVIRMRFVYQERNMCGIVGYLGKGSAQESLVDGLRRLEYRGYDSAGVAFHEGSEFSLSRETGRVENLANALRGAGSASSLGIAHTRWATHGAVTVSNTHPHQSHDGKFVMVHNGVIENFGTLKRFLEGKGISFSSETDSEVLCNLIAYHYSELPEDEDRFIDAVRLALPKCRGAYGIAVLCLDYPDVMIGARRGSPLVVGLGEDANFIASDASAFVGRAKEAVFLNDGELAVLDKGGFRITTLEGQDAQAVDSSARPDFGGGRAWGFRFLHGKRDF